MSVSSSIGRVPNAILLPCDDSTSKSGRREKNVVVVCAKVSSVLLYLSSFSRVSNGTFTADAAATTSTTQRASFGMGAKILSSRLVALAARRRRRASFQLGMDSDDDDDLGLDNCEDFNDIEVGGSIRKTTFRSQGETDLGSVRTDERVDDWSQKARQRAILSIQERGLPVSALLQERRKKKKQKKNRKKKKQSEDGTLDKSLRAGIDQTSLKIPAPEYVEPPLDNPFMSAVGTGGGFQELAGVGNYWKSLAHTGEIRIRDDVRQNEVVLLIQDDYNLVTPGLKNRVSKGPQKASSRQRRQEDFDFNRSLVEASTSNQVLSLVRSVLESSPWGEGECPLSPRNISTALHRIAKHMELESMLKSDRLSYARQKTMALLVSAATESLPQCSAQSISNIAWALSKVGGSSLYWAEMDLLAQAAISNVSDLEPQHVANIAGAFASMQHSNPFLFEALDRRAYSFQGNFHSQELTQLLWAFATLNEPAELLLDSLDSECETSDLALDTKPSGPVSSSEEPSNSWTSAENYFSNFTLSELCSLSWSYTVLNELKRPSFALIWNQILNRSQGKSAEVQEMARQSVQLSQFHQTSQSLDLEYPELNLRPGKLLGSLALSEWERLKAGKMSKSATQKDVEMLLASTGRQWVGEYSATSHSLDVALVEERIALEVDGPTHFARNTGTALGHTVLKRRQLSAAGWTVLSIPYLEWDELLGEQEQMQYLRALLKNHL